MTVTGCPMWCHKMHKDDDDLGSHTRAVGEVYMGSGSVTVELAQIGDQLDHPFVALTDHGEESGPREIRLSPDEVRQLYTALGTALAHLGRFEVALAA